MPGYSVLENTALTRLGGGRHATYLSFFSFHFWCLAQLDSLTTKMWTGIGRSLGLPLLCRHNLAWRVVRHLDQYATLVSVGVSWSARID